MFRYICNYRDTFLNLYRKATLFTCREKWGNQQKQKYPNFSPPGRSEMITADILEHTLPLFLIGIIQR